MNHGFIDGNERIRFTAADVFLPRNGFYLKLDAGDAEAFIKGR